MSEAAVDDGAVVGCVARLLGSQDLASTTVKQLIRLAEQRLGLQQGALQGRKALVKATIADYAAQQHEDNEEDNDEEEEEEEVATKKKKRGAEKQKVKAKPKAKPKAAASKVQQSAQMSEEDHALAQLRKLAKAARKGPTLFKGLPALPVHEQITTLRERLRDLDLRFSDVPTDQEIKRVELARQRELDLDGIDTSLIISGGRRSRKSATSVAEPVGSVESDEEDDDEEQDSNGQDSDSDASEGQGEDEKRDSPPKRKQAEKARESKASSKRARTVSDSEDEAEFEF